MSSVDSPSEVVSDPHPYRCSCSIWGIADLFKKSARKAFYGRIRRIGRACFGFKKIARKV